MSLPRYLREQRELYAGDDLRALEKRISVLKNRIRRARRALLQKEPDVEKALQILTVKKEGRNGR